MKPKAATRTNTAGLNDFQPHVYVAHRDKGYRDAHNFYVYEVATDTLTLCSRFWSRFEGEPSCESLLAATGIDPDDTDEPNSIGGWLDWRYLSGSDYEFRRYWWQPGSAAALWRRMRETMNCAAVQPPSATRSR